MSDLFHYRWQYPLKNLSHVWWLFKNTVKNIWAWRSALGQCPCCFNLRLLLAHLVQLEKNYDHYELHSSHDDTLKQIRSTRYLLNRVLEDEYNWPLIEAELNGRVIDCVEFTLPTRTPRQVDLIHQSAYSRANDWKYLCDILKKHGQSWWT